MTALDPRCLLWPLLPTNTRPCGERPKLSMQSPSNASIPLLVPVSPSHPASPRLTPPHPRSPALSAALNGPLLLLLSFCLRGKLFIRPTKKLFITFSPKCDQASFEHHCVSVAVCHGFSEKSQDACWKRKKRVVQEKLEERQTTVFGSLPRS